MEVVLCHYGFWFWLIVYTVLLTTSFGHGWGMVQTVNAVPDWKGDIIMDLRETRCKGMEWCQVVGFC